MTGNRGNMGKEEPQKRTVALVALGANLGDAEGNIHAALQLLASTPGIWILKTSSLIKTEPVGGPVGQPCYFNGAVLIETTVDPYGLLDELHQIENKLGRVRNVVWGPRTVDLDLIIYGDVQTFTEELTLPHPRLYWRRFVLDPACEIAPELTVPTTGLSLEETRRLLIATCAHFGLFSILLQRVIRAGTAETLP